MSAVMERTASTTPARRLNRRPWSAWNNGDERVRAQINEPALAKAFAKVVGVTRTGYSVMGPFTAIYLTPNTRDWVEHWMRGHNQGTEVKAQCCPVTTDKTSAQVNGHLL